MSVYYNEIDPPAVAILRHLISEGVIADGIVDERSIKDVEPGDLRGFSQCHFFAGGGLWSVAARLAGWPDDQQLWTGSCPCQPFSAAGKGGGTDDPRHLWPDFHRLISACRPAIVVGEQVAGAAGYGWFDGVRADLEREGYAGRAVDFPACAVDAPHQRNRLYWVAMANADRGGCSGRQEDTERIAERRDAAERVDARHVDLVDAASFRRGEGRAEPVVLSGRPAAASAVAPSVTQGDAERPRLERHGRHGDVGRRQEQDRPVAATDGAGAAVDVAHGAGQSVLSGRPDEARGAQSSHDGQAFALPRRESADFARGRNGTFWSAAEWLICHDGKARRAKPGLRLLVDGLPGRVDLWRVGGNAIVPEAAVEVLAALRETIVVRAA